MERWNSGIVEQWNSGTVEQWNGGTSESHLKSGCLRDQGRLENEGRPILLKIGTQSRYVDLCNMPKF